ncbi:hypothetical protein INR49_003701 [Caranx melampygus]|nr:hypothetical protein INR49_003701 [Caranx melampygus]
MKHLTKSPNNETQQAGRPKSLRASAPIHNESPITTSSHSAPSGRQSGQQVAEPQTRRVKEEELVGYKSYSPSFSHTKLVTSQQAHSFRDPGYSGPHQTGAPAAGAASQTARGGRYPGHSPHLPCLHPRRREPCWMTTGRSSLCLPQSRGGPQAEASFRRTGPRPGSSPSHYTTHVDSPAPRFDTFTRNPSPVGPGPPAGPMTCYVPACSVVSSSKASSVAILTSTSVSPILFSSFVRLHSQDCSSIKSRRSSYLLAITTERSKSCDEGLNTFRKKVVSSKLPKRVKSFFTDGSLESLRVQEEAQSKRHSTSELGTITFSDVRKEGWLHYKQILTEKGKTSERQSSRGRGRPSQDEHPPVSIRGCLIDIAYSETKRKHTLRLTTQDFCEYLLQAEDRDDMLAWIRVIRENSKTDNEVASQTPLPESTV